MEALQANAVPAVEQDLFLRRNHWGRPPRDRAPTGARTGQHGLQVSVTEPPWWRKVVAVDNHGGDIPERSAHSYLDAIICAGRAVPLAGGEIAGRRGVLDGKDRWVAHHRLDLQRSVRRMTDVASEIGESERRVLRG